MTIYECDHCLAQRVYPSFWQLKVIQDDVPRIFCGLDCLYNWTRDEWNAAVQETRKPDDYVIYESVFDAKTGRLLEEVPR